MRKVVFAINISTDGYCGHTDMIADAEMHEYFNQAAGNASLLLFGRITYQLMVPYWPDIARTNRRIRQPMSSLACSTRSTRSLFSTTLKHVEGQKPRIVRTNVAEEVVALKQQPGKDICVGSLSIASQLSGRPFDWTSIISWFIRLLPEKDRGLFETVKPQDKLQLDFIGSDTFQSGVVALRYRRHFVRLWIVSDSAAESPGLSRRILIVLCLFLFAIGIERADLLLCIRWRPSASLQQF